MTTGTHNGTASLMDRIEARIANGEVALPPANRITARLQAVTTDPDFNINEVVELIASDQALTSDILRVANGAFYGGLSEITTVKDAVVRLGAPEVTRLAVLTTEKVNYTVSAPELNAKMPAMWLHAVATAMGARWLARKLGFMDLENEAFIAGLLHDVGNLLLVRVIDDLMTEDPSHEMSDSLLTEILDSGHTRHGHALAEHWHLPEMYCDVIRNHHEDDLSNRGTLICLVALADKACAQMGLALEKDPSIRLEATDEAYALGANDIVLAQLVVMLEDAPELA